MYKPALESLRTQIRASTTSMTSVPKPLKFLRPHYDTLKTVYEKIKDKETQVCNYDFFSLSLLDIPHNWNHFDDFMTTEILSSDNVYIVLCSQVFNVYLRELILNFVLQML